MSIHVLADGSSPLTRGKPLIRVRLCSAGRLIPAHAGKTLSMLIDAWSPQAHPRSRGENQACSSSASAVVGSSPLTRGKLALHDLVVDQTGLIPAHAGKTALAALGIAICRAHPRSRGENANFLGGVVSSPGSSPLTRGKRPRPRRSLWGPRLIPAHAGKTPRRRRPGTAPGAHPRSRGENFNRVRATHYTLGSSPLTRGKPRTSTVSPSAAGLIPAHAGKTRC